jgi:hypothetical protein
MSEWVVIAWKNQPNDQRNTLLFRRHSPLNAHYTPVKMNRHIPSRMVAFVAETPAGRIPVFDANTVGVPLGTFVKNLKTSYRRSPFRARRRPRTHLYVVKPYTWLLDQFGQDKLHGNNTKSSPFYIPFS